MNETPTPSAPHAVSSQKATWSLGLSIAGLCCLGPLASVPAIILGHLARASIRKSNGLLRGRGRATTGLAIAYTSLALQTLVFLNILFLDQLTYRMTCLTHPPTHTFDIRISDPSCSAKQITRTLSSRLHDVGAPHKINTLSPDTLQVKFAEDILPLSEAKSLLTCRGLLEFRLVHPDSNLWVDKLFAARKAPPGYRIPADAHANHYIKDNEISGDLTDSADFGFRGNSEFMLLKDTAADGSTIYRPLYVEIRNQLPGTVLADASAQYDMNNRPYISIIFNDTGAERFASITTEHINRRLGVVLDGTLYTAPMIREPIFGGMAQITGEFTNEEALTLAALLRAGSLPCPLEITREKQHAP